ncbi:MAG: putative metal-dependent phosphoesterase family [Dehalococcoidia bacterium]|nr:putative metal-dependent phosphoesterase family [Dehalococcoidia bacterium]
MAEVDLHLHTTFSDGRLTPTQLIQLLASKDLKYVAVTDHDSTEGLPEALSAAKAFPAMTVIPGMELSTEAPGGECHILCYYVDPQDKELQQSLATFRGNRKDRGRLIVERLAALGMPVSWERVLALSDGGSVGRPHIARAMIERGYVATIQEAFDKYLGRNGPAYAERDKMTPQEGVALALKAGALPVLAHPTYVEGLDTLVPALKEAGLVGMEVYYKGYDQKQVGTLRRMAELYNLIPCGGSDYHATGEAGEVEPGLVGPPMSTMRRLEALKERRTTPQTGSR